MNLFKRNSAYLRLTVFSGVGPSQLKVSRKLLKMKVEFLLIEVQFRYCIKFHKTTWKGP